MRYLYNTVSIFSLKITCHPLHGTVDCMLSLISLRTLHYIPFHDTAHTSCRKSNNEKKFYVPHYIHLTVKEQLCSVTRLFSKCTACKNRMSASTQHQRIRTTSYLLTDTFPIYKYTYHICYHN